MHMMLCDINLSLLFFLSFPLSLLSVSPSLSPLCLSGRFDVLFKLPRLDIDARIAVLQAMLGRFNNFDPNKVDLRAISIQCEGASAKDLMVYTGRVVHANAMRLCDSIDDAIYSCHDLSMDDFQAALEGWKPAAIQNVSLTKSTVDWSCIGGLDVEREELKAVFQLPMMYSQLFDSSPIPLARGVLLYGPPGCGKTLLASAIAGACGLNFISVKGPEMLSKYIGQSEQVCVWRE